MDYLGLLGFLCPYLHTARFSALQQIMLSDSLMLVPAYMIIYFPHTKILFAINGFTFSHSFSLPPTLLFSLCLSQALRQMDLNDGFISLWKWSQAERESCTTFSRAKPFQYELIFELRVNYPNIWCAHFWTWTKYPNRTTNVNNI